MSSTQALRRCPALFISAPSSGQGKTTVTAAIARFFLNQGKQVRVFKTGPDYLDPQILQQASGQPVMQLDMWMAGEQWCQQHLYDAAETADLILIEGAMGLFDGDPSSADLAARLGIPVALLMDLKGMAQTTAAIALGLANYRDDFTVAGLIANGCSTARHRELIDDALPDSLPLLATLKRDESIVLPERHLGLVQACEVTDELELAFEAGAKALEEGGFNVNMLGSLFSDVVFYPPESAKDDALEAPENALAGLTIGIAQDAAFSFIYSANIALLESLGATCYFFSPLNDQKLPELDGLWLPGGYPELYAQALSENTAMHKAIQSIHQAGKPILAECGGYLYCLDQLTDLNDDTYPMLGLLQGEGAMRGKRGCQGMQTAILPEGDIRGHAHHRSRSSHDSQPISHGRRQRHPAPGEAIYRDLGLTGSYLHLFFPSNPSAIAALFSSVATDLTFKENSYV
jgi:cobyrinic acid a,c-diamide synthase